MARFSERTAIVTGAGSGLGRAVAARLAAEGAAVACLDLNGTAAKETADAITGAGRTAIDCTADVTDADALDEAVERTVTELGRPSVLVTCAGIGRFYHSHEMPVAEWNKIVAVNLTGTFLACRATIPSMFDGGGVIVTIASSAGLMSVPYAAAYCASKAAVVHLTKELADEYLERKIRVVCIAPGGIDTPLQETFAEFPEGVEFAELEKVMTPLGTSTPEEIAGVVAFVASDEARYMTGAVIPVDGGLTM